jgi:glycosyltransferase involved in cell wall biosynthesis
MVEPQSCILFSTADWDAPYWTNKQHTAAALGQRGTVVLYIESVGLRVPSAKSGKDWSRLGKRLITGLRTLILGPKRVQTNVWVLSPLVIPFKHSHPWVRWFNQSLMQLQIGRFLHDRQLKSPLIWTYHPYMLDTLTGLKTDKLVYHCVDDLSAIPGIDATTFKAAEQNLLYKADVVFATAPRLADQCALYNTNTHFLPNVVDADHFGKAFLTNALPPDLSCIPEPRLGYHGVLSDFKIDFQLLMDVARLNPQWSFVFIGEEREGQKSPMIQELSLLPNVHFLGYRAYEVLPEYLRGIQVGLLPSLINEYTHGMFPMKYYEYLAAGVPVVSTPLSFSSSALAGLLTGATAEVFATAVGDQLFSGRFDRTQATKLVADNTWDDRLLKMLNLLSKNA